jgi:hypothetical protein
MGPHQDQQAFDEFVPDAKVAAEFGITLMSLWRWSKDPVLRFPPAVKIRERNFRSRRQLEQFKQRLLRTAIGARGKTDEAAG